MSNLTFRPESIGEGFKSQFLMVLEIQLPQFFKNPKSRQFFWDLGPSQMAGNWVKRVMEGIFGAIYVPKVSILTYFNIRSKNIFHSQVTPFLRRGGHIHSVAL